MELERLPSLLDCLDRAAEYQGKGIAISKAVVKATRGFMQSCFCRPVEFSDACCRWD